MSNPATAHILQWLKVLHFPLRNIAANFASRQTRLRDARIISHLNDRDLADIGLHRDDDPDRHRYGRL